jgi:hypothetical protein
MAPLSLFIPYIDNKYMNPVDETYIKNVFHKLDIANVSGVDFIQKKNRFGYYNRSAFVHIRKWMDNSACKNLIEKIMDKTRVAKLVYDDPVFWILKINYSLSNAILDYKNDLLSDSEDSHSKLTLQNPDNCLKSQEFYNYNTPPFTNYLSPPKLRYKNKISLSNSSFISNESLRSYTKAIVSKDIENACDYDPIKMLVSIKDDIKKLSNKIEEITEGDIKYFVSLGLVNSKYKNIREEINTLKQKRSEYLHEFLERSTPSYKS